MSDKLEKRRKQLAAIHVARRDLGMDEDDYRLMLRQVMGVESARDLDASGRQALLDHLRRIGWKGHPRKRVAQYPGTPHNLNREQMLQKIEAQLADMKLPWSYADAIARQQTGIDRVAWLRKAEDLKGVISALYVEQEKRSLWAALEQAMERLGISQGDIEREHRLRKGWQRNRKALRHLLSLLSPEEM